MSASMHVNALEHRLVLGGVARDCAIEVRGKLYSSLPSVIHWGESVDQGLEAFEGFVIPPFSDRFHQKRRFEATQLFKKV